MHIDIHIPRPGLTLLAVAAVSGWSVVLLGGDADTPNVTAQVVPEILWQTAQSDFVQPAEEDVVRPRSRTTAAVVDVEPDDDVVSVPQNVQQVAAELRLRQLREEQAVLLAKEDILRAQLEALTAERDRLGTVDPALEEQFRQSVRMLTALLQDSARAERFMVTSLNQIWEAEGRALALAQGVARNLDSLRLLWPVQPSLGISATFHDKAYEQRFKMRHDAIDIPVLQGSPVAAAAGGIVKDAVDHGLGFNYITIEHPGGYSTLYGHLSKLIVQPGDRVIAGDIIGASGGRPGTPGAGFSTGPHVHFGLYANSTAINPMEFLPTVQAER